MNKIRLVTFILVTIAVFGCSPSKISQAELPFPTSTFKPTETSDPLNTLEKFTNVYIGIPDGMSIERGGDITITSNPNIIMKNIKISICPTQLGNNWQNVVYGINSFAIEIQTPSLEFSRENSYKATCQATVDNQEVNFSVFRIGMLPAEKFVYLNIKVDSNVKLIERTYEGKMYIKTPINFIGGHGNITLESVVFGKFAVSAVYLIQKQWGIADFKIIVECDNCNTKEETFNLSFRESINIAGCKILTKDEYYITESCSFWFLFTIPENSSETLSNTDDHYFLATKGDAMYDSYDSVVEISKEEFFRNEP